MKMILVSLLMMSTSAFAVDLNSNEVSTRLVEDKLVTSLTGKAAQMMYFSLNVKEVRSFGMVQTSTKTTKNAECISAILGDIPGQMSAVNYSCTVVTDLN